MGCCANGFEESLRYVKNENVEYKLLLVICLNYVNWFKKMYTDEFMEALALLYLHPADFCPLATRKSYICTRLVSLLVALDCNGHFEAVLESEGVMC